MTVTIRNISGKLQTVTVVRPNQTYSREVYPLNYLTLTDIEYSSINPSLVSGDWEIEQSGSVSPVPPTPPVIGPTGNPILSTDDLPEGAQNLYFTDTRAQEAIQIANVGSGLGVYKSFNAGIFDFYSIAAGPGISVAQDGNNIVITNLGGGEGDGGTGEQTLESVDVTLTPFEIEQLGSVPVTLLPSPGAGLYTVIDSVEVKLVFNTAPYTGGGSDLYIDYAITPSENMSIDGNVLLSTETTTRFGQPVYVLPDTVPIGIDQAITISTTSPFLSGDSNLEVRLRYRIYTALT